MAVCKELIISPKSHNVREFIFKVNIYLTEDTSNSMIFLRTQIASFNRQSSKNVAKFLSDEIRRLPYNFKYIQRQ